MSFDGAFLYGSIVSIAFLSAILFARLFQINPPAGRIGAIDGLRGFLALAVFAHHFAIWRGVLHGEEWAVGISVFEFKLGKVGVSLFFMITAFLFCRKIMRSPDLEWSALYLGRLFRIYPLYLALLAVVIAMAFALTGPLQVGMGEFVGSLFAWLVFEQSPINGFDDSMRLIAGVVWTLAYEFAFYLCLPIFALLIGRRVPAWTLLLPPIALLYIHRFELILSLFSPFLAGIAAAFLVDQPWFVAFARRPIATAVVAVCLVASVAMWLPGASLILGTAFCLIAAGCSLQGLLTSRLARTLGEVTYSMYLLHGIILAALFYFVLNADRSQNLSSAQFALMAVPLTVILVGVSFATFKYIERPGLQIATVLRGRRQRLGLNIQT